MNIRPHDEQSDLTMPTTSITGPNEFIARMLEEVARAIDAEHADEHRIAAYRHAAQMLREMRSSIVELYAKHGEAGLQQLRGIGKSLAETIASLIRTGELPESKGLNLKPR